MSICLTKYMVISNPRRHEAVGQIQDPLENLGK